MFHNEEEQELSIKALNKVPVDVQDEGCMKDYLEKMTLKVKKKTITRK